MPLFPFHARLPEPIGNTGRHADSSFSVADRAWSRVHASIEFQYGGYVIRDLGSVNGTYVNGRRVKEKEVEPLYFGATIAIGGTVLTFTHVRDPTLPDLTGTQVGGRYDLERLIRESAKAAVYSAADSHLPRRVAIKLLSPEFMRFPGYREQFAREAEMAAKLQHPHICRVLDSGIAQVPLWGVPTETHFLCYELMEGGNLADRLGDVTKTQLDQVSGWIEMLGSALSYLHARGVVHADLKPTAVVFDAANQLYLTDFAIAQGAVSARGQPVVGSPAYIAPEQWEGGTVTPATDQFAFAALSYYMITGSKPYEGLDNPEIRAQQFRRGPDPAHEVAARKGRPGLQRALSDALRRGLGTSIEDRYPSVEQFTRAVRAALGDGRRLGGTPQVFISYDRELSGGWARYFGDRLKEKYGLQVFMDTVGLDRVGRFPPRLAQAIEDCDVFICFLAGSTLRSKWVNEEIRLAHEHRKLMIPIFQESYSDELTEGKGEAVSVLTSHQGVKLFDVSGHYVEYAVADLAAMIKRTIEAD